LARLRFARNWFSDGWIGTDAYIEIVDCTRVQLNVYLPERESGLEGKELTIFDGTRTISQRIGRGRLEALGPFDAVQGAVRLQIYATDPEDVGDSDARPLGVLLAGLVDDGKEFNVASFDGEIYGEALAPLIHPDAWAIVDRFDPQFYLEHFAQGRAPADPLLHFMLIGWREGLDPNRSFSLVRYLQQHPDLAERDVNPFVHFATAGQELRKAAPSKPAPASRGRPEESSRAASRPTGAVAKAVHSSARAYIEAAAYFPEAGRLVAVGWALGDAPDSVWLETDEGERFELLDSVRIFRSDVFDAHGRKHMSTTPEPGFIALCTVLHPPHQIRAMSYADGTRIPVALSETAVAFIGGDPRMAFQWLHGMNTPSSYLNRRIEQVDVPLIGELLRADRDSWKHLRVHSRQLGTGVTAPSVSVIVPLYGRADFVEHQLAEFVRDRWFVANCQLIYVVDDPALVDTFKTQAEQLHALYRMPFEWVWGSVNRGFAGANNLGADYANGQHLIFMNSDVFPMQPGWVQALCEPLETRPHLGAVAPRLLFSDGSIQHASIEFLRREDLGVWINHHPLMGLAPDLDPRGDLTSVDAVTGACLAVRREEFEEIGRWDTGYLIGDFEDSDLCLKLRSRGYDVAYLPTVELTHLERQSFRLLGQGDFRQKVVIHNAMRHQMRWRSMIEAGKTITPASANGERSLA
jgi:GT2 family glycosyltransferase